MSRIFCLRTNVMMLLALLVASLCVVQTGWTQSNQTAVAPVPSSSTNLPNRPQATKDPARIRDACIQGRRMICGRVLEVTRSGIVVDSGYTSLMQPPFNHSWVVPAQLNPQRTPNLIEGTAPDSPCVGLVFLTDIPHRPPVHQYDYVVIHGYPAGTYDYKPLEGISKKIRRFSAGLETAVKLNLKGNE